MKLNEENEAALREIEGAGWVLMNREQARKCGATRYFPGPKPGNCGHVALRRTRDGGCAKCGSGRDASYLAVRQYKKKDLGDEIARLRAGIRAALATIRGGDTESAAHVLTGVLEKGPQL